jgi:hypothetical protein
MSVSGTSQWDVWAVGSIGAIVHWDGSAWSLKSSGTGGMLRGVWAGPSDAWAVGVVGTIIHNNGSGSWMSSASGTTLYLTAVWNTGSGPVWAVGQAGTILFHN